MKKACNFGYNHLSYSKYLILTTKLNFNKLAGACLIIFLLSLHIVKGQVCSNAENTVYGLSVDGIIQSINITNGNVGTELISTYSGNPASASNSLGYNKQNGKFYYFKRKPNQADPEFVSFDPNSNVVTILAEFPLSGDVRTGCINNDGTGYYCTLGAYLYYYDIALDEWTEVCSSIFENGTYDELFVELSSLGSGDIAFDGDGNLWWLASSNNNYGLYKIQYPVPKIQVDSLIATKIISPRVTNNNVAFTGIAFFGDGSMYLSQNSNGYLYKLNSDYNTLNYIGTLSPTSLAGDLASCAYPLTSLPVTWLGFKISSFSDEIILKWDVVDEVNVKAYEVLYSIDLINWDVVALVPSQNTNHRKTYEYVLKNDKIIDFRYFKIKQIDFNNKFTYSSIETINKALVDKIVFGPSPCSNKISYMTLFKEKSNIIESIISDLTGKTMIELPCNEQIIDFDVSILKSGVYVLSVINDKGCKLEYKFVKN